MIETTSSETRPARRPGVRRSRRHSAMLVPDMNKPDAIVPGHGVGPIHVCIPHQREYGINALRDRRLGEDFIGWQFH
jgi:hypothetical protein